MNSIAIEDLSASETTFITSMQRLGFGLIERLQIRCGELVLDPPPKTIQHVKFGTAATTGKPARSELALRQQIAEFFTYVREVETGEIRTLEIRHGLPFSMEIELAGSPGLDGRQPS